MKLVLILFGVLSAYELASYSRLLWGTRRVHLAVSAIGLSVVAGMILIGLPNVLGGLLFLACLYRIFNSFRVLAGRMNDKYARRAGLRTSAVLMALQVAVILFDAVLRQLVLHGDSVWRIAAAVQLVAVVLLLYGFRAQRQRIAAPKITLFATRQQLPTLSVCIPARNETQALQDCLECLVASDYPKLEILVLDDCSQSRRTSEIIKDFAHAGVVFVKGEEPKTGWLAKNQACQKLYEASSGDVLLFCGVDLRVRPDSLRLAVDTMLQQQRTMLTVLPQNVLTPGLRNMLALVLQPLRYAYELLLPRWVLRRPPVLSTCWLARRELLKSAGAFDAVSHSVIPERHFAKAAVAAGGYGFVASDDELGVTSSKPFAEQYDTAIRLRYPQTHRQPEAVYLITACGLSSVVLPLVMLGYALLRQDVLLAVLTLPAMVAESVIYLWLVALAYRQVARSSLLAIPFAVLADIVVLNVSMYKYEFSEVVWKGRNVCLPPLEVISRLPPLH